MKPYASFPTGSFRLEPHHAWLWSDAVKSTLGSSVHPGVSTMIAFRGAGATISDVMDALDTEASKVLFGELEFVFAQSLRVATTYLVDLAIMSVERKTGRRFPVFDRVTLTYVVMREDRSPVVTLVQRWIVDRTEAACA